MSNSYEREKRMNDMKQSDHVEISTCIIELYIGSKTNK